MEKEKIDVYTSKNCGHCVALKKYLKSKNIKFKEFDIDKNIAKVVSISKKTGYKGLPIICKTDNCIMGFDKDALDKMIG